MTKQEDVITRLGENLLLLRKAAGWTASELGERVGVTRQTINNIEKGAPLTKTLYLAIRCIFSDEINNHPKDTEMLQYLLDALVDHPEKWSEEQRIVLIDKAQMLTPSIMEKTKSREAVSKDWFRLISTVLVTAGAIMATSLITDSDSPSNSFKWISAVRNIGSHKAPQKKK